MPQHGSVRKRREGVYSVRVSHGYRSDGKPRSVSETVYGTEAQAHAHAEQLWVKLGAKINMGDEMSLSNYFDSVYLPTRSAYLTKSTISAYKSTFYNHVAPIFGDRTPSGILHSEIQKWVLSFRSPAMARKSYTCLRFVLRAMFDDGLLDEKPMERRVRLPYLDRQKKRTWDARTLSAALVALKGDPLEPIALVMSGAGLRREEALALRMPTDFTFSMVSMCKDSKQQCVCRVRITKAFTRADGIKDTKTGQRRIVTIGEPFSLRLKELMPAEEMPLLVSSKTGKSVNPSSAPHMWRKLFAEERTNKKTGQVYHAGPLAGYSYIEFESLRHTHETLAALGGIDASINSLVHGHSQKVEYDHYLSSQEEAADAVASVVGNAMGQ